MGRRGETLSLRICLFGFAMGDLAGATLGRLGGGLFVGGAVVGQVGDRRRELILDDGRLQLVGGRVRLLRQTLRPSGLLGEVTVLEVWRVLAI